MNWYKAIWSRLGGIPWTYILRDAYHKAEFIWIVGLVSLGIWLGHNYGALTIIRGWLIFSIGYFLNHFRR